MYRLIVVPLDGSPCGERALPLATRIARHTGAALELVHVHRAADYAGLAATHERVVDEHAREGM